ncbi:hypothetical protein HYALB_00000536 [Hymenoscyphus albidus]|uniref:Uncharacterized protein n=1 Tax=Hymenoscyphus albidus TaxID=595503 RepID=A0A9N9QCP7_9HELO|nr:hypothetical protein HYALB_00000536 [Hymenoscyphus albidus]
MAEVHTKDERHSPMEAYPNQPEFHERIRRTSDPEKAMKIHRKRISNMIQEKERKNGKPDLE